MNSLTYESRFIGFIFQTYTCCPGQTPMATWSCLSLQGDARQGEAREGGRGARGIGLKERCATSPTSCQVESSNGPRLPRGVPETPKVIGRRAYGNLDSRRAKSHDDFPRPA